MPSRTAPKHSSGDARFVALTPTRKAVLELVESEGAISKSDIVSNDLVRGRNTRTAAKMLKDLHALGLIQPIRICEYRLSVAGLAWLDAHRTPL